jgi:hypothetical protein
VQTATKVGALLTERQKAIQAIRREARPKIGSELERARDEVSALLEPDKAKAFRQRFEDLKRRWMPPIPPESKTD